MKSHWIVYLTTCLGIMTCLSTTTSGQDTSTTEKLFDLSFDKEERDQMAEDLENNLEAYQQLHAYQIPNSTPPALLFNQLPVGFNPDTLQGPQGWNLDQEVSVPANREELAFYTVAQLGYLLKNGEISSIELTELYLNRLKKFGDTLQCVVTLTEDLALRQAARADEEIEAGNYRGPLHGIPYGIKDLFAVKGYPTTWGATPFKDQVLDVDAEVYQRLEKAGAVLVAKLTLGALAWGDVWFGGVTKNPWDLKQGSSGSSAGSASATAAGLVAFSIGTETLGSIVSPSNRCGLSGLRPTFGRVSRTGGMNLSWSMDKVGPICRSALDAALVFDAIRGSDGQDQAVVDAAFNFTPLESLENLKVGYFEEFFAEDDYLARDSDRKSLEVLRSLGAKLEPVTLPDNLPLDAFGIILATEAAAAFDQLTRSNQDELMVRQIQRAWPNVFRASRLVPAVEYINANRVRYQLVQQLHELFRNYDVIITPSFGGNQLQLTNLTGHPVVVVPNGFDKNNHPTSISFLGNLFDEATILAVAQLYQSVTNFDEMYPPAL